MTFNALVIAHEDSSYDSKKGRISQETLTCLDADPSDKLKDTVDCVFATGAIPNAQSLVGKTLQLVVTAIRPTNTQRMRFVVKGLVPAK